MRKGNTEEHICEPSLPRIPAALTDCSMQSRPWLPNIYVCFSQSLSTSEEGWRMGTTLWLRATVVHIPSGRNNLDGLMSVKM